MNPAQVHLSELMEARGPGTAEALAKFVGTGKSTAHRWQAGETFPRPKYHAKIEEFFGLTPGSFSNLGTDVQKRLALIERENRELRDLVTGLQAQVALLADLIRSDS